LIDTKIDMPINIGPVTTIAHAAISGNQSVSSPLDAKKTIAIKIHGVRRMPARMLKTLRAAA